MPSATSTWVASTGAYDPGDPFNLDLIAEVYIGVQRPITPLMTSFVNKTVAYLNGQHTHLNRVLQAGEWLGFAGEAEYGSTMMDQLIDVCSAYYTTYGIPSATFDIDRLYDRSWYARLSLANERVD